MNFLKLPFTISVVKEGCELLRKLVYKNIVGKWFKIEHEVGDIKYCTTHEVEEFVKQVAIPVRNVGYYSLNCFDNI